MAKKILLICGSSAFLLLGWLYILKAGGTQAHPTAPDATTARVSTSSTGAEAYGSSSQPSISADGSKIAFYSEASNLVEGVTNGWSGHIYVKDLQTGAVTLASKASDGTEANNASLYPGISADGNHVAFTSGATNLVTDTVHFGEDIFVHDLQSQTTVLISKAADGTPGNGYSGFPDISATGRYVVFESMANNLVPDDLTPYQDIFLHDRDADADGIYDEPGNVNTLRVSVAPDGTPADNHSFEHAISANGRFVTYRSNAGNLVPGASGLVSQIYLYDRDVDADGIYDEPGQVGVTLISIGTDGLPGNEISYYPAISPDGSQVAFVSDASNLIPNGASGYSRIFVRDWQAGATTLASESTDGQDVAGSSYAPALSEDGRYVVFESISWNLVPEDTNNNWDIFLRDRDTDGDGIFDEPNQVSTRRVSVTSFGSGSQSIGLASSAAIDWGGTHIAFDSDGSDLIYADTNDASDVFLRVRVTDPWSEADISVAISGKNYVLGNAGLYTFTVSNTGPGLATHANLSASILGPETPPNDVCEPSPYCEFQVLWFPPPGGGAICNGGYCYFNPLVPSAQVYFVALASFTARNDQVYQGSTVANATVVSVAEIDPDQTNNTDRLVKNYYRCDLFGTRCVLDDILCNLFYGIPRAGSTPLPFLQKLTDYVPELALYYWVRDDIMRTTPGGHRLADLYYAHSDEISDLVFADSALLDMALTVLELWEPHLRDLLDGEGSSATITAAQVAVLDDFLSALSAAGSQALGSAIADERANLPPLGDFIGLTMDEARGQTVGYAVYLPALTR